MSTISTIFHRHGARPQPTGAPAGLAASTPTRGASFTNARCTGWLGTGIGDPNMFVVKRVTTGRLEEGLT